MSWYPCCNCCRCPPTASFSATVAGAANYGCTPPNGPDVVNGTYLVNLPQYEYPTCGFYSGGAVGGAAVEINLDYDKTASQTTVTVILSTYNNFSSATWKRVVSGSPNCVSSAFGTMTFTASDLVGGPIIGCLDYSAATVTVSSLWTP